MYDKRLVTDILEDMLHATQKIQYRCAKIHCVDDFLDNEEGQILLDSICMLLIALGEGVKQVDKITYKKLFSAYPQVEWKRVAGIRDVLSHHYFDLNAETVYGLCQKHIKRLEETLTLMQTNLNQQSK